MSLPRLVVRAPDLNLQYWSFHKEWKPSQIRSLRRPSWNSQRNSNTRNHPVVLPPATSVPERSVLAGVVTGREGEVGLLLVLAEVSASLPLLVTSQSRVTTMMIVCAYCSTVKLRISLENQGSSREARATVGSWNKTNVVVLGVARSINPSRSAVESATAQTTLIAT